MAGTFTDYLENNLLDYVFSVATFIPAATLYVGLSTTTITDAGGNITEPVAMGYARVAIANNATNFPAASGGAKANATPIAFASATGDWGILTDFFISDAVSGGNIYVHGALTTAKAITNGDTPSIAVNGLTFTLD